MPADRFGVPSRLINAKREPASLRVLNRQLPQLAIKIVVFGHDSILPDWTDSLSGRPTDRLNRGSAVLRIMNRHGPGRPWCR